MPPLDPVTESSCYFEPRPLQRPPPRWLSALQVLLRSPLEGRLLRAYWQEVRAINARDGWAVGLSSEAMTEALEQGRQAVRRGATERDRDALHRLLALLRELCRRELGMRPYDVQMLCALAMLDRHLVQLAPGEGKTLTLALVAVIFGWSGRPCHVMTANDYLAARDVEELQPLYRRCGLTAVAVGQETDAGAKPDAYAADLVYSTAKQLLADYLQDTIAAGAGLSRLRLSIQRLRGDGKPLMMRGLHSLIVDEADSLLIDEATTPLIISGPEPDPLLEEGVRMAHRLVDEMRPGVHYRLDEQFRDVRHTAAGEAVIARWQPRLPPLWRNRQRCEDIVRQAILARDFFLPDRHYVVLDEKVVIVDEGTGRLMPGRTWSNGLHQAVEARAGVPLTPPNRTLAKMSFQNFFKQYHRLCGASGTLQNIANEVFHNYRSHTLRVPSRLPSRLRVHPFRAFPDQTCKWDAVLAAILERHRAGLPVLIGSRSVADSERLAGCLGDAGLALELLNAKQHEREAEIIACAGQPGRITVATNMAGRGTDIKISAEVAEQGGLVVIMLEPHESARVDWQLFGRAGRQGNPGEVIPFAAASDDLLVKNLPIWWQPLRHLLRSGLRSNRLISLLIRAAQRHAQGRAFRQRQRLNRLDRKAREMMSFVRSS